MTYKCEDCGNTETFHQEKIENGTCNYSCIYTAHLNNEGEEEDADEHTDYEHEDYSIDHSEDNGEVTCSECNSNNVIDTNSILQRQQGKIDKIKNEITKKTTCEWCNSPMEKTQVICQECNQTKTIRGRNK